MALNLDLVKQVGEWNPQLFRELKGRLKPRNILISVAISLVGQLLVLMSFASQLPVSEGKNVIYSRYCTDTSPTYPGSNCLADGFGGFVINWSLWWKDVFVWLSFIGIFALLVFGTYMLLSDLSKEEHRGTLNFVRLAPQSSRSILTGKLLGVPILLYLVGFLALPLHLAAGLSGQIPLHLILAYYGILGASCLFFYSLALLFGLVGTWLGGFQAWLGGGAMLLFLYFMMMMGFYGGSNHYPTDWLALFNPAIVLPYLINSNSLDPVNPSDYGSFREMSWFYLPISASGWSLAGFMALNYGLWTYWVWQGLKRCFHNPSATLLRKQHSYWLTACFEVVILGFALNSELVEWRNNPKGLFDNLQVLLVFNLQLFLCLIAALSPHRQVMQDWARYRHQNRSSRKGGVIADLIWGEKSPALVAVALNAAIASAILLPWILLWPFNDYRTPALWALLLNLSLVVVYAAIAQLMLFMKMPKRAALAATTVGLLVVLPPIIFVILSATPGENSAVWLFSAFPWAAVEHTTAMSVFMAIIGQSLALGLLSLQLTRQLQKAGESSTKALFAEQRRSLSREAVKNK